MCMFNKDKFRTKCNTCPAIFLWNDETEQQSYRNPHALKTQSLIERISSLSTYCVPILYARYGPSALA